MDAIIPLFIIIVTITRRSIIIPLIIVLILSVSVLITHFTATPNFSDIICGIITDRIFVNILVTNIELTKRAPHRGFFKKDIRDIFKGC